MSTLIERKHLIDCAYHFVYRALPLMTVAFLLYAADVHSTHVLEGLAH